MSEIFKQMKISDFCQVIRGASPRPKGDPLYYGGDVPRLMVEDVTRDGKLVTPCVDFLTKKGAELSRPCKKGTLTVVCSGTVGIPSFLAVDACIHDGFLGLININKEINHEYLYYQLVANKQELDRTATHGGIFTNLTTEIFKNTQVDIPDFKYQQKIAQILSTCDRVIEKTEATIAKYQAIKQGMMHDLFTRGIDTKTGKLRARYEDAPELYKESDLGWIPREWEVMRLDECVNNLDGQRVPIKKEDRELISGDIPYYGASGIIDYVDKYLFNEPLILLGEDGENVIARNTPLAFKIEGRTWVNNHAHVLQPKTWIDIDFLTELLESRDYSNIVSGSAQPKINQANLNKVLLSIPQQEEQKLSASRILSQLEKIGMEIKFLDKMELLKSGLMHDLLMGKVQVEEGRE